MFFSATSAFSAVRLRSIGYSMTLPVAVQIPAGLMFDVIGVTMIFI